MDITKFDKNFAAATAETTENADGTAENKEK